MDKLEKDWNGSQLWSVMRKTCWPNSYSEFIFCYLHRMMQCFGDLSVADPGEEPETAPPYLRVWMTAPPYLKVWIRQWFITWHNAVILPFTSNFTWYIANKATHCKQNEVHSLEKPPFNDQPRGCLIIPPWMRRKKLDILQYIDK